jgi:hypothetical protein
MLARAPISESIDVLNSIVWTVNTCPKQNQINASLEHLYFSMVTHIFLVLVLNSCKYAYAKLI